MVPALVLGSGLTALGVIRTLRRAGIPAFIYDIRPGLEARSRWYRPAPLDTVPARPGVLADVLQSVAMERAVLIPCSDDWARQVSDASAEWSRRFPASIAPSEVIDTLVDKAHLADRLEALGVPHPFTLRVEGPETLDSLPDHRLESAFLKPRDSQRFFARFGVKGIWISSREQAADRIAELQSAGFELLLQQYIPGPGSLHYFVDGFIDRNGALTGALARQRLRMYPSDFGNSSLMITVPPKEVDEALAALKLLLGDLGYRGIFSTEFKRDPRDGLFKLIEVNSRAWWYVEYTARCGVDVCTMAYRDALGEPVPRSFEYEVDARLVYPYYDIHACREDPGVGGHPLVPPGFRAWLGAQHPLFNWSDPWPAVPPLRMFARRVTRRSPFRPATEMVRR